jgi:hypothetical protein
MLSVAPRCRTGRVPPAVTDCDATIADTTEHQTTAAAASIISITALRQILRVVGSELAPVWVDDFVAHGHASGISLP